MMIAIFGMKFGTKLIVLKTEQSSVIVGGVFKSTMALIRSSLHNMDTVGRQNVTKIVKF